MTAAITIHFRKPDLTRNCIDSLLADGWAPILVWDNSDDEGRSLIELQVYFGEDTRVQWANESSNVGFGKGMNGALAVLAERGYVGPVLLINNDAHVTSGMRMALQGELEKKPFPTLVAPRIIQNSQEQGWFYYQPWLALVTSRPFPGSFPYLSGCCLLVNRIDNSQPLFDDAFFMYGEDVELSWRLRRQGMRLVLHNHSYVEHIGSASSSEKSELYEFHILRSHWILAQKLGRSGVEKIIMRFTRAPILLARAIVRSARFRSTMPVKLLLQSLNSSRIRNFKKF